jgi:hypothetical protein
MTAQEALERWEMHGDGPHLPQIYRDMGLTRLRILVAEEAKPSPLAAIDRMPIPRLNYNPLDRALLHADLAGLRDGAEIGTLRLDEGERLGRRRDAG